MVKASWLARISIAASMLLATFAIGATRLSAVAQENASDYTELASNEVSSSAEQEDQDSDLQNSRLWFGA